MRSPTALLALSLTCLGAACADNAPVPEASTDDAPAFEATAAATDTRRVATGLVGDGLLIEGKVDDTLGGRPVTVAAFMRACGVALIGEPVDTVIDDDGLVRAILPADEAADLFIAVVDIDDDGHFDQTVDIVLVSNDGEAVDARGRVGLGPEDPASAWGAAAAWVLLDFHNG
jgi:hypothetical protein